MDRRYGEVRGDGFGRCVAADGGLGRCGHGGVLVLIRRGLGGRLRAAGQDEADQPKACVVSPTFRRHRGKSFHSIRLSDAAAGQVGAPSTMRNPRSGIKDICAADGRIIRTVGSNRGVLGRCVFVGTRHRVTAFGRHIACPTNEGPEERPAPRLRTAGGPARRARKRMLSLGLAGLGAGDRTWRPWAPATGVRGARRRP